ncbi:hypothetical protein Tsp_08489 [Trichinella spiralis]|uniref:hypothetical protein n=1 Tax=Trichinella spiralis TaxID=6334 RepID=UPI0001EFB95F|nr:hypothetical protein Tsp_08489 [Trichinella spiralis]
MSMSFNGNHPSSDTCIYLMCVQLTTVMDAINNFTCSVLHFPTSTLAKMKLFSSALQMDSEDELKMRCQLKYPNLWYRSSCTITHRLIAEGIHKYDMQSNSKRIASVCTGTYSPIHLDNF